MDKQSQNLIRVLVTFALCAALTAAAAVPIPEVLPAVAVGQVVAYRLEVALLVFYGFLLLITPAASGIGQGRLPTEISTRGAKFAEGAERSAAFAEVKFEDLKQVVDRLSESVTTAHVEIEELKRDNTQRRVNSTQ